MLPIATIGTANLQKGKFSKEHIHGQSLSETLETRGQNPHGSQPVYISRSWICGEGMRFLQNEHVCKVSNIYINRTVAGLCNDKLPIQANIGRSLVWKIMLTTKRIKPGFIH